jgi:hypothetical protein
MIHLAQKVHGAAHSMDRLADLAHLVVLESGPG